jgi:hypothetical protein
MSEPKRIYFRPDDDLPREEGIRQATDALIEFIIEQFEARGDHEAAVRLRARLAEESTQPQDGTDEPDDESSA